jgi:hypothetical protein
MNNQRWDELLVGVGLGVAANILFALLLVYVRRVRSLSIRHVVVRLLRWSVRTDESLRSFLLSQLGGEIEEVFPNRAVASRRLYEENAETKTLKIMTNRGAAFADPASERDHPVSGWKKLPQTRVMLMNPESEHTVRRFRELKPLSAMPGWDIQHFKSDIMSAAQKLRAMDHVEFRFHNEPSVFRVVITDKFCYFSGFPRNEYGRNKPVLKVRADSFLYALFDKYFEEAWNRASQEVSGAQSSPK